MVSKKCALFLMASAVTILLDQLTKLISVKLGYYSTNYGAAFSILQNRTSLMIWAGLIVVGLILYYYGQIPERYILFAGLLIGGTIGNLIDRILFKHVIDFINLRIWPSFNIADIGITIGVLGIAWLSIKGEPGLK